MLNSGFKEIDLTNLLLNTSNPRFNPVRHQRDAIHQMLEEQGEKILVLAKHIVQYGLNPSELIIVMPYDKQWVVREGNRRITALKLISEPSLIPSEYGRLKHAFKKLNKDINNDLFKSIGCIVLDDEEQITEWVRLKHTGENKGAGTVRWDAQQISRYRSQVEGKPDMQLAFLESVKDEECIPKNIRDNLRFIKKTNFDRLIKDPDVRNFLGMEIRDDLITTPGGINPFLIMTLRDLVEDAISVKDIYYKQDRRNYIEQLKKRCMDKSIDDNSVHSTLEKEIQHTESDSLDKSTDEEHKKTDNTDSVRKPNIESERSKKMARGKSYPLNRATLIPSSHNLTITNQPRVLKIFRELKTISVEKFPNAVAVLFRVFIELSMDCFIEAKLGNTREVNVDKPLSVKIDTVIKYMENNKIMDKHELKAARQMNSSPKSTHSVRTFHNYVHNRDFTPLPADLMSAWDDLWKFVENVWRCIS